jgi:FkbM family methyltransferase
VSPRVAALRRLTGAASRRLGRPELLAAVSPQARQAQHEEIGIRAALASALRCEGSYVDVGTNRGQILREAVRVAPRGRHVAFEPIPALADEVARAFAQVDVRQLAVGAHPEYTQFCHFTQLDGWSGLRRQPQISDARGRPQYIDVEVSTLDAQLADLAPSVVKIDVEGAELGVLEGGRAVLTRARPVVILEHVGAAAALYETTSEAVWDLLEELRFNVFAATGDGPFTRSAFAEAAGVVNWLATPSQ